MNETILCAAIHFKDGLKHEHQPINIESGYVVCGRRHHNCFVTHAIIKKGEIVPDKLLEVPKFESEQGFITDTDRFVDRSEAAKIAAKSKQIKNNVQGWGSIPRILFSEHLY
jgi:hypothetical protein